MVHADPCATPSPTSHGQQRGHPSPTSLIVAVIACGHRVRARPPRRPRAPSRCAR
jgi:hypothetical protein